MIERMPDDGDPWNAGYNCCHEKIAAEIERLRVRKFDRRDAILIAGIIQDEIGGEVCTPEWAQAAADRIVCAFEQSTRDEK